MTAIKHVTRWIGTLCAAAVVLAVAGCSSESGSDAVPTLERLKTEGVVRVGFANEAPYAYTDTETGEVTGEAPEIARAVLGELGIENIEGVSVEFDSLIPGLKAGRFDIVAAGMYITPKRCEQIDFSNPTYSIGEAFVVAAGNPHQLHAYEDVRDHASAVLGVVNGTVELGYARDLGIPDDRIEIFPDAPSAVEGVKAGRIDAYGGTSLTVDDLLRKANDAALERAQPFVDPVINGKSIRGYGAFGFRPEDDALREAFNAKLATFIGSDEHLALVEPFGFGKNQLPGSATAAQLCAGEIPQAEGVVPEQ